MASRKVSLADQLQAQALNVSRILLDKQLGSEVKITLLKAHKQEYNRQFDKWIEAEERKLGDTQGGN